MLQLNGQTDCIKQCAFFLIGRLAIQFLADKARRLSNVIAIRLCDFALADARAYFFALGNQTVLFFTDGVHVPLDCCARRFALQVAQVTRKPRNPCVRTRYHFVNHCRALARFSQFALPRVDILADAFFQFCVIGQKRDKPFPYQALENLNAYKSLFAIYKVRIDFFSITNVVMHARFVLARAQ
jgi:hypothetical protein